MRHHSYDCLHEHPGEMIAAGTLPGDDLDRLLRFFRRGEVERDYATDSQWSVIYGSRQAELVKILLRGDREMALDILSQPHSNFLFYGFEDIHAEAYKAYQTSAELQQAYADRCKDLLVRLAEALGLLSIENPEGGRWGENIKTPANGLAHAIEERLGVRMGLPPLFQGYYGLQTSSGLITERMINGVYAAQRIRQLTARQPAAVAEIGGGLGHAARYSVMMGIQRYTLVDLPLTGICQAAFLMRTLGPDKIWLEGEPPGVGIVRVCTPSFFFAGQHCFDLVVNIDGMTEYGRDAARAYMRRLPQVTPKFLSINHEANAYRVHDLLQEIPRTVERFPYWMRNGYVEEVVRF